MPATKLIAGVRDGRFRITGAGRDATFTPEQVIDIALQRWSIGTIHDALGEDASAVLPESHDALTVSISMPRCQVESLQRLASLEGVDIDTYISRQLCAVNGVTIPTIARVGCVEKG